MSSTDVEKKKRVIMNNIRDLERQMNSLQISRVLIAFQSCSHLYRKDVPQLKLRSNFKYYALHDKKIRTDQTESPTNWIFHCWECVISYYGNEKPYAKGFNDLQSARDYLEAKNNL